jgi:pimeloyl-ACP methyl ester carboxylesterase
VRLITYDRPGYGGSTRHPQRSVADAASDVRAIADTLGIERFAVVGRSGGGPHALACAALLPERIMRTAVLVGLAPATANDLDWYAEMADDNVATYSTVGVDLAALTDHVTARAEGTVRDPESLLEELRGQMVEADRRIVDDVSIRQLLAGSYAEALSDGPFGWIDDIVALRGDWGFDPSCIASPVLIWHGADDTFSPVRHARWLAGRIPGATIHIESGAAHFGAVEILPEVLVWLIGGPPVDVADPVNPG